MPKKPFIFIFTAILILSLLALIWPPSRNLEYEYVLLVSWLNFLVLPFLGYLLPKKYWDQCLDKNGIRWVVVSPFFAILPAWVFFRLNLCLCAESGFVFWFLIQAVPTTWIGVGAFLWIIRLRREGSRHFFVVLTVVALVVISIAILFFLPQKRLNSFALGYLHGPIYDRWIPIDYGVILGRLAYALIGLVIAALAFRRIKLRSNLFVILAASVLALMALTYGFMTGGNGFWAIERYLDQIESSSEAVIHYANDTDEDRKSAKALLKDAVFHINEIRAFLGIESIPPIHIYAYKNDYQKKLLFGGADTDITDVWTPSVHIELTRSPHSTLRHELVHAVSSFVSWNNLGFHPNMIFTEGLAMALAPSSQELDFDIISAGILKSKAVTSIKTLLSPVGFWSESGARSYYMAGSFIRWLNDKLGPDVVRKVYSGATILEATGQTDEAIYQAWQETVLVSYDAKKQLMVERITRAQSALRDTCPHTIEDLSRPSSEGFLTTLRQPLGWNPDHLLDWRLTHFPKSQEWELERLRRDIKIRIQAEYKQAFEWTTLLSALEKSSRWPPETYEDLELALMRSDLEFIAGEKSQSARKLIDLQVFMGSHDPGSYLRRAVEVRMALMNWVSDQMAVEWRKYVAGWLKQPPSDVSTTPITDYLIARRQENPSEKDLKFWMESMDRIGKNYPEIRREWLKIIALGHARNQNYKKAADAFSNLADLLVGEPRLLAMEHYRRMIFFDSRDHTH